MLLTWRVLQSFSVTGQSLLSVGPSENWPESCTSEWVHIFIGKTNGGRKKGNWKGVTCRDHITVNIIKFRSPIKQATFRNATTGFPAKWRLSNKHRNSILMTRHYPDLDSASGWSCRVGNLLQPIRSTTQMCDNISNTWLFYAKMAQFTCMFVIEPILSTDLTDFFVVAFKFIFWVNYKYINESFAFSLG